MTEGGPAHRLPHRPGRGLARDLAADPVRGATSGNWGGYVETANAPYSTIAASWIVPTMTGNIPASANAGIWVGIDGWGSPTVEQTGVNCANPASGSNFYQVWTEYFPAYEEWWDTAVYPAAAGDHMSASVTYTGTSWLSTLSDSTQGWTYTITKSVYAMFAEENQTPARASIEVIVESGANTANFGTLTFTGITPMASAFPVTMVHGSNNSVTVGALSGNSFTATWGSY
jgi:peptidase A4-like protein